MSCQGINWLPHMVSFHLTPAFKASSAILLAVLVGPVSAGQWKGSAAVSAIVGMDQQREPNALLRDRRTRVWCYRSTVPLSVQRQGARVKFLANYIPTCLFLFATTQDQTTYRTTLTSLLSVEAVDDFFFVDASANIYQTFISPLLPRPETGFSVTNNRTQSVVLGLSPYIKGVTANGFTYSLRSDNSWSAYSQSSLGSTFTSNALVNVESPVTAARLRYAFEYNYFYTKYEFQPRAFYQQAARLRPIYTVSPKLTVNAVVGYETNDYFTSYSGAIYGGGLRWNPTPRTELSGFAEHRFFGLSYGVNFNHRRRLTSWALTAYRNTYSSTAQLLTLTPGTTQQVLNAALLARYPDPFERQQVVGQLLAQAGLPPVLTSPYTFYTNQIYLAQGATASAALLGKKEYGDVDVGLLGQPSRSPPAARSCPAF